MRIEKKIDIDRIIHLIGMKLMSEKELNEKQKGGRKKNIIL